VDSDLLAVQGSRINKVGIIRYLNRNSSMLRHMTSTEGPRSSW